MKAKSRAKTTASTQEHLEVREVVDDLVLTTVGSVGVVIQTTAVNFDLLSEYEQDNKIYAFAGLLNSLGFHIQILIRTNRIDITNYISYLKGQHSRPMSAGLKKQLTVYTQFVQNLIVQNDVLDKKFYLVIPYTPSTPLNTKGKVVKDKGTEVQMRTQMQKDKLVEQGKIFLYPKRDHILKQLSRMGLMGHQLVNKELLELYYDIYNPES